MEWNGMAEEGGLEDQEKLRLGEAKDEESQASRR